jgi:SRSO17 transposase
LGFDLVLSAWIWVSRGQPPRDHAFVRTTKPEAAAAARIGAGLGRRKRAELLELLRPCFARTEAWLQAGKYAAALMSGLPRRNGWTIAEHVGDRAPDKTQRLLSRAVWDTVAAMAVVRRFAVAGLDQAARRAGRRGGLVAGAVDETSQVKQGEHTAGVKRHYLGCAGKVANGITTVHLAYVREQAGHALIGARQWIPAEHLGDPVKSQDMGLPADLAFRTKGQLAIDILTETFADGIRLDFVCGDEVYGSCTQLRAFCEARGQAYVLRVPSSFHLNLALSLSRLIRAAGLRWPVEESFEFSKDCFGLDQSQVRLYTAIARHTVLVMAALAICAITAASLRHRTDTRAPAPSRPDQPPPANPGMIPLTVPETGRLLAHPPPRQAAARWLDWRRHHQARSAWYHQRTRLAQDAQYALVR